MGSLPSYATRYLHSAGVIAWDPEALAASRLDEGLARSVHVATILEEDTAISARQARSFHIDRSLDIAAFLPVWEREEAEHGRALRFLLDRQGFAAPERRPASIRTRRRFLAEMPAASVGRLPSTALVFCALGAAAEYLAMVSYTELTKRVDDPTIVSLLRCITNQEGKHFAFFLAAARARAEPMSAVSGRLARRVLSTVWEPIGVASLGTSAWRAVYADWLDDASFRARVARMDRVLDTIPHLVGLHLMAGFLDRWCGLDGAE